ncbi:MAG TPA: MBL fold metallo-hydrolase [Gemmatimonadaceae bacterium]|nr:MBL fold metallo-hydrolase [Gemmatimonadaceae bacterium]
MRRTLITLALPVLFPVASASSQSARNFDRVRLADGVYAFVQHDPLRTPVDGNSTVIIGDADVVVVDSRSTPASARALIAEIRALTSRPVRYVINTHWHSDHHYGNDAFRKAYPGVEIVSHAATRADMLTQDNDSSRRANIASIPGSIVALKGMLAAGKGPDGKPMPEEVRSFLGQLVPDLEWSRRQLMQTVIAPPTMTITDRLVLHRGARTIDIRFLGRANTRGDLVVYLPNERIVITGDVLVAPIPFAFGSYPGEWVKALAALRALDATTIVPGHGPIQRDWSYLDQVAALLRTTLAQAQAAVAEGKDLEATRQAVNLDSLRRLFVGTSAVKAGAFENVYTAPAVERAYLEAKGQLEKER